MLGTLAPGTIAICFRAEAAEFKCVVSMLQMNARCLKFDGISNQEYKLRHAKFSAPKEALLKRLPVDS